MTPALARSSLENRRLLIVNAETGEARDTNARDFTRALSRGDAVVVNDAATIPASLPANDDRHGGYEVRLSGPVSPSGCARIVVFGEGDWTFPTEARGAAPLLGVNQRLSIANLPAHVTHVSVLSPRLVEVQIDASREEISSSIWSFGVPVQYSYARDRLALWDVQTTYGGRPWAVEAPSAGYLLDARSISELHLCGIEVVALTHAAGLSSTGDAALDAALPFPELTEIPSETVQAIHWAKNRGKRVIGVGTSVVRALEGRVSDKGLLEPGLSITTLRIDAEHKLQVVDGIVSGIHAPGESHHELLRAFVSGPALERALGLAALAGYQSHEFGDHMLVIGSSRAERSFPLTRSAATR